ncbi:MAG TPA: hypothetical protein VFI23_08080 [Rhizomicrobium sp.]|nr:hypothetical protein [Rhizomicrobium sp.]
MARRKRDWPRLWGDAVRFHLNRLRYGFLDPRAGVSTQDSEVAGIGILRESRVRVQGHSGRLQYCIIQNRSGLWQGYQFPWVHLEDFSDAVTTEATAAVLRRLLARLPGHISFGFVLGAQLPNAQAVAELFRKTGFKLSPDNTFYYTPPAQAAEVMDGLTGKSIKGTLRRARRDLDLVEMTAEEFALFHKANIEAAGKASYRDWDNDRLLLELGKTSDHARAIGVRRKSASGASPPFDAAVACTWNRSQNLYKFWRLTYRQRGAEDDPNPPHPDATKLLLLDAMEHAASLGLEFDTDGTTPGMTKLFSLFGPGVFRPAIRIQCVRDTIWSVLRRDHPSLTGRIARLAAMILVSRRRTRGE